MKSLDQIAIEKNTDKSSKIHDYCVKYEKLLQFDRASKHKMLEIGILNGASLSMWSEYYPNAQIVGLDINADCKKYAKDNIKVEIGNQSDVTFLKYVAAKHGPFDLIVDDGSHIQEHVIISFESLFPHVVPGGIYIVEDTVTSYWPSHNGGLRKPSSMVEYFKDLIDDVNFHGIESKLVVDGVLHSHARRNKELIQAAKEHNKTNNEKIRFDIESISFYNSFIFIRKSFEV